MYFLVEFLVEFLQIVEKFVYLQTESDRNVAKTARNGLMAEWLGRGLQNLVQRFESASDLEWDFDKRLMKISRFLFAAGGVGSGFTLHFESTPLTTTKNG